MNKNFLGKPTVFFSPDPDAGGNNSGNDDENNDGDKNQEKKLDLTQKQLDELMSDRVKRASQSTQEKILKDLGVEDLKTAQELLKKQKEAEEAQKTELQKIQDAKLKAEQELEKAKTEKEQALQLVKETNLKGLIEKEARDQNFRTEALSDVWLIIDRSLITEDDKGNFLGIKQAVETVAKAKPFWLTGARENNIGTPGLNRSRQNLNKQNNDSQDKQTKKPFTL